MGSLVCHILECGHVCPAGLCPFSSVVSFCKEHTDLFSYLPMSHNRCQEVSWSSIVTINKPSPCSQCAHVSDCACSEAVALQYPKKGTSLAGTTTLVPGQE